MGGIDFGRRLGWIKAGAGIPRPFRHLALAIAWLLLWRVSALMQYAPHASLWFPPAGLSFAALLVMGWRALPVLMGCSVLVTFWVDRMYHSHTPWRDLLLAGVLFGVAHCLSYGAGAGLLKRVIRRSASHSVPTIIMTFLATSCLSALCAALLGVEALKMSGMLGNIDISGLWLPWWIGDMAGAQVLTPLFVGLLSWRYPSIEPWLGGLTFQPEAQGQNTYGAKLGVSVSLVSAVILLAAQSHHPEAAFGMFFLIIPQMWIVYTESPFRSALSLAVFSTTTALLVAALGLERQALIYQFAICVIAASAYFGFAVPALIAQNKQLSELALKDGLTKALTRSHFFELAEHELVDARRYGQPLSLLVMDIDHFKHINDSYGHSAGDAALINLVRAVRMQLRQSDLLGRFGGDEFMVLMPGLDLDHALAAAERLRELLGHVLVPGTQHRLSACFGVACVADEETIMQAFRRADEAMLATKREGRVGVAAA